jgi:Tol biopolymer transport system component
VDVDLATLTVSVDAGVPQVVPTSGEVLFADVAPGERNITLGGVAGHCAADAPNPRSVRVVSGAEAQVHFAVTCRTRIARVVVTPAAAFLLPGDTATFAAAAFAGDGSPVPGRAVRWQAPDGAASVSEGGLVTGLASGTGRLRATIDGVDGGADLVVGAAGRAPRGMSHLRLAQGASGVSIHQLWTADPDGARPRAITPAADDVAEAVWAPDGARAAVRYQSVCTAAGCVGRGGLYVVDRDGANEQFSGAPALFQSVAWSPDGTRLLGRVSASVAGESSLQVFDPRTGRATVLFDLPGDEITPQWSPDGSRIAFLHHDPGVSADRPWELWVVGADGRSPGRLGAVAAAYRPRWSPDGTRLAFDDGGPFSPWATGVWVVNADGTGLERLVLPASVCPQGSSLSAFCTAGMPSWSPDGRRLTFGAGAAGLGAPATLVVRVLGSAVPDVVIPVGACCGGGEGIPAAEWSPDGRWLLFGGRRPGSPPWPSAARVPARGGAVEYLTDAVNAFSPRWVP